MTKMQTTKVYPVAPFAGAWIEINLINQQIYAVIVAPFAGAWIEIPCVLSNNSVLRSLPSRERGLKSETVEIDGEEYGRSLRGSVD